MDRYQLEEDILNFHNVAADLDMMASAALEDKNITMDAIANGLIGLAVLLRMRTDKTFDTFKAAFKLDKYSPEQQTYTREY